MSFLPTDEERHLMKKSVLLPMVLDQVEHSRVRMNVEKLSLKRLYLMATELLARRLKSDIAFTKNELRKKDIKVVNPREDGYAFVCRSHVNSVEFRPDLLQHDIQELLAVYVDELGHDIVMGAIKIK